MAETKNINIAFGRGRYVEIDQEFQCGDRFRLCGTLTNYDYDMFDKESLWWRHQQNNKQIDTWAYVNQDIGKKSSTIKITLENVCGTEVRADISRIELKALMEEGKKREAEEKAMAHQLALHCVKNNIEPICEPTALHELNNQGKLSVGNYLVVDGVNYGVINDVAVDKELVIIETDKVLMSTNDCTNEFDKQINPCYQQDAPSTSLIDRDLVVEFMIKNHDLLPLKTWAYESGFNGAHQIEMMSRDRHFLESVGQLMGNYAHANNITDVITLENEEALGDIANMIKCEMVSAGYIVDLPTPSEQALNYLQNLGYDEAAMGEKANILNRWINEKQLTDEQKIAAQSIIDNKILYVVKDIDQDSMKTRRNVPFVNLYTETTHLYDVMCGGKVNGTCINMATGEEIQGTVIIPPTEDVDQVGRLSNDCLVGQTQNAMYVTWDVSREYKEFGGFEAEKALERTQEKDREVDGREI